MNRKKVIVAGHICLDITPVFPGKKVSRLDEMMAPGKLIHMNGVEVHTGGVVANTGLAMKLLGADVSLMGKIGKDEFGRLILQILGKYGYTDYQDMIQDEAAGTSYSVVIAVPGIDRIFLHAPGANDTFCFDDLNFDRIREASLFHFGYPPLMARTYRNEGEELVHILKKVKELGVATSLDMAAVDPASEAGKADWQKIMEKAIPYVDFFVPSVEELCCMLEPDRYESWLQRAGGADVTEILNVEKDVKPLADRLMDMGAKALLIKCGAPGLYYRTADEEVLKTIGIKTGLDTAGWSSQEGFERSYQPSKILSGTGAGDTSIAAYLTAMLEGKPLKRCVQLAAATGASCVEAYDALGGLKSFRELEEKIDAGWEKI